MKFAREFAIIIAVSFLGEIIKEAIPLPIPASIYGLVLMLIFLCTKAIRLEWVEGAGNFLVVKCCQTHSASAHHYHHRNHID